jgi:hypothetical protein
LENGIFENFSFFSISARSWSQRSGVLSIFEVHLAHAYVVLGCVVDITGSWTQLDVT